MPSELKMKPAPTIAPEQAVITEMMTTLAQMERNQRSLGMQFAQWKRKFAEILKERPDVLRKVAENPDAHHFIHELTQEDK